jgi:sensor domain CHASE-containing protein
MQFLSISGQISPFRRLWATHRILLVFVATILVAGILLSSFGLRALIQERRLVDQQIHERLAAVAEGLARRLELELLEWQQAAEQVAQTEATNSDRWPARVRAAVEEPGSAVVLSGDKKRAQAAPETAAALRENNSG